MKRLVYCLDGTSNTYDAAYPTNVVMTHKSTLESCDDGTRQIRYYDEGVGTRSGEKVLGGAFGFGLMVNVIEAYKHLCENYEENDQIFIFGFSRGAYTARTFAGLIRHCGIVEEFNERGEREISKKTLKEASRLYKSRLTNSTQYLNQLNRWRVDNSPRFAVDFVDKKYRKELTNETVPIIEIQYIGVWDTVKTLGINANRYKWHNHNLSEHVRFARHAVAIDERREKFDVTLWDNIKALNAKRNATPEDTNAPYLEMWFPGDHGSVGGGGPVRGLSDGALTWILEGAQKAGLVLQSESGSQVFKISPNPLAPLKNTPPPAKYDLMTRGTNLVINAMGLIDRSGPNLVSEVSHSAKMRFQCPENNLPEQNKYRPGSLKHLTFFVNGKYRVF